MKEKNNNQTGTNGVHEAIRDRESRIDQNIGELRKELTELLPSMREFIEKHPMGSAGSVLAAGLVVGYWIAGRKRKGISRGRWLFNSALEAADTHLENRNKVYSPISEEAFYNRAEVPRHHAMKALDSPPINAGYSRPSSSGSTGKGVFSRLMNMVVPMVIEKGLRALEKDGSEDGT